MDQEINFDSFYEDDSKNATKNKLKDEEDNKVPNGFESWDEYKFYGGDQSFMRFHKRTRKNMHDQL